ncbi:MAG TPA: hypothetical protein VFA33_11435 [Bryobacteraceae bacterium]|nr:hypothetical protein [Bryobacteraceae bacterium]
MRRTNFSAGLYLALVFLSGALVGGFGHYLYTMKSVSASTISKPKPEDYRKRYIDEMHTRLKLTDAQVAQLVQIMDNTREHFRELHERTKPQLDAIKAAEKQIQTEHRQEVRAMLTDSQRAEYERIIAEREKRRQQEAARKNQEK